MGSQRWSGGLPSLCSHSWQTQTRLRKSRGSPRAKGDVYYKSVEKNRSSCSHALRTASVSHFDPCALGARPALSALRWLPLAQEGSAGDGDVVAPAASTTRRGGAARRLAASLWLPLCPGRAGKCPGLWGCGQGWETRGPGLWGSLCPGAGQPGAMPGALTAPVPAPCLLFCSRLGPCLGGRGQQTPHGPPQGWQMQT